MNKIILIVLILLGNINIFAQKIEMDKVDENGDRYIFCSFESLRSFTDKIVFFTSLNAAKNKNGILLYDIVLRTNANVPLSVPKGGKLLIKLIDDSVIELKTAIEYSDKIGKVNSGSGIVYTNYSVSPSFLVTPEQIKEISKGVKKIRLETVLDAYDKEFKKDKMGKIISDEYFLIKEALSKSKSFSEGF